MTSTWIAQTGQTWKLYVFWLLFGVGTLFLLAFIWSVNGGTRTLIWPLGFVTFITLSLVWLLASIRCPKCAGRPTWWIVRHASASDSLEKVFSMRSCPICGEQPVDALHAAHGTPSKSRQ